MTRPTLNTLQKAELAATWGRVACSYCGQGHGGLCPRVKRIRIVRLPNGSTNEDVTFWATGRWKLPKDTVMASDVFDAGVPPIEPPPIEATATVTPPKKASKKTR